MKNNETMKIKDADSLKKIQAFLKNADIIIKDKTIKLTDPSAKTAFSMVATGGVLVALSLLPVIGPFVAIGATPMLASTGIGLITPAVLMMKDLNKAKSLTYKNALEKQTAIIKALREEQDADNFKDLINGSAVFQSQFSMDFHGGLCGGCNSDCHDDQFSVLFRNRDVFFVAVYILLIEHIDQVRVISHNAVGV